MRIKKLGDIDTNFLQGGAFYFTTGSFEHVRSKVSLMVCTVNCGLLPVVNWLFKSI